MDQYYSIGRIVLPLKTLGSIYTAQFQLLVALGILWPMGMSPQSLLLFPHRLLIRVIFSSEDTCLWTLSHLGTPGWCYHESLKYPWSHPQALIRNETCLFNWEFHIWVFYLHLSLLPVPLSTFSHLSPTPQIHGFLVFNYNCYTHMHTHTFTHIQAHTHTFYKHKLLRPFGIARMGLGLTSWDWPLTEDRLSSLTASCL